MSRHLAGWLRGAWARPAQALSRIPEGRPGSHLRLVRALAQRQRGVRLGPADMASLVRAVARCEAAAGWSGEPLEIPLDIIRQVEVSGAHWERTSTTATLTRTGLQIVTAPWRPGWIEEGAIDVDTPLYEFEPRRRDQHVPADPFVKPLAGYDNYQSAAQREAVRAVLSAPPGATVVVNLPTGSGKTLCGLLPALRRPDDMHGAAPFVVPTVALMLDLERRVHSDQPGYRSAYRPDRLEDAAGVRLRVEAGLQGLVFVSPESLAGSLRSSLHAAARAGHVRVLVVDEAHMVGAWGDEFRPAFQQIASVRRELLRSATEGGHPPFVTVLMSATLPGYRLRQLADLFGEPGPVRFVHAVRLRPEPVYHVAQAPDDSWRRAWLLEAVHHLPRPLILYTVKRADAERWHRDLLQEGFARVGLMHGGTEEDRRRAVLAGWNDDSIDVVVATSAFGLGVDKQDVRAVLHAALPESVDRFYQEVGRGGRDGFASLSLLVWQGKDWGTANALMGPTLIGEDRGRERWEAMYRDAVLLEQGMGRFRIDLSTRPSVREGDIDMDNEEHRKWNLRTLLLLTRAGLLELDWARTTDSGPADPEGSAPDTVVIRLRRPHDADAWWAEAEQVRSRILEPARETADQLRRLLVGKSCVADVLRDCYRSDDPDVPVVLACGGCRYCRATAEPPRAGVLRCRQTPDEPWPAVAVGDRLREFLGGRAAGVIFYRRGRDEPEIPAVVRWLLGQKVVYVWASRNVVVELDDWLRNNPGVAVFADALPPRGALVRQPALAVVGAGGLGVADVWPLLLSREGVTVAILPDDSPQPDHPARRLTDMWTGPRLDLSEWKHWYDE